MSADNNHSLHTAEAAAIEEAIREHQRTVADRDQEIRRLERRLEESEGELRMLRVRVMERNFPVCSHRKSTLVTQQSSDDNQLGNESQVKFCDSRAENGANPQLTAAGREHEPPAHLKRKGG
ncbi:uncharacterized protein PAE49_005657 [Odontesthes bonariensis]